MNVNWDEAFSAVDIDSPRYAGEPEQDDTMRACALAGEADLLEALEAAEECWGEVQTQHLSECSLAGDSWPGAVQDIQMAFGIVIGLRKRLGLPYERVTRRTHDGRCYQVWGDDHGAMDADISF